MDLSPEGMDAVEVMHVGVHFVGGCVCWEREGKISGTRDIIFNFASTHANTEDAAYQVLLNM